MNLFGRFNRSLQARLTLFSTISVILALGITAVGVLVKERETTHTELNRTIDSIGALIAANAQAPLLFEDRDAALSLLDALAGLEDDIDGCILDADGEVFAAYPTDLDWKSRRELLDLNIEPAGRQARAVDVSINDEKIGTVLLSAGMDHFYAYMKDISLKLMLLISLALAASLYIGRKTMQAVLHPLENLEQGAREIIENGDYALRVPHHSRDELGKLTDSFNAMLEQIEARDGELMRSHTQLEQRVIERTRDLELEIDFRKKAEDSMRVAMEQAETANRAKSEFLANMSHELRTPLHGILSFAQFGLRECDSDDITALSDHFGTIKGSGETLLKLLDDLLDLAKMEAGRMTFDFQPCCMDDLIEAGVGEFDSLVTERHIDVRHESHIGELEMLVDPTRVLQVLRNLLSNAIKFSPGESLVHVRSSLDDGNLLIEVMDSGIGIPDDEYETIFDKFIQSSKTKTGAGGTGLGLAITREITEAHGGRAWASPNPTGGAIFSVVLPVRSQLEIDEQTLEPEAVAAP